MKADCLDIQAALVTTATFMPLHGGGLARATKNLQCCLCRIGFQ